MKGDIGALLLIATMAQPGFASSSCPESIAIALGIDVHADRPFSHMDNAAHDCAMKEKNGLTYPDPRCTPGAVNPTVTVDVLLDPKFKTGCLRDRATSPQEKDATYLSYGITKPLHDQGADMICEKDHLVPLELGGADTLDNIWPQCGPDGVPLAKRLFRQKDMVESYLSAMVKHSKVKLATAQERIAVDWSQFLERAREVCHNSPHGFICNVVDELPVGE